MAEPNVGTSKSLHGALVRFVITLDFDITKYIQTNSFFVFNIP